MFAFRCQDAHAFGLAGGAVNIALGINPHAVHLRSAQRHGAAVVSRWDPSGFLCGPRGKQRFESLPKRLQRCGPGGTALEVRSRQDFQPLVPDGRFLLYTDYDPQTKRDLWVLSMSGAGEKKPEVVVRSPFDEFDGRFSPDGHWIAYTSIESGKDQVYVQGFPKANSRIQISSAEGGTQPRWRQDGKELYFFAYLASAATGNGRRHYCFRRRDLKGGSSAQTLPRHPDRHSRKTEHLGNHSRWPTFSGSHARPAANRRHSTTYCRGELSERRETGAIAPPVWS